MKQIHYMDDSLQNYRVYPVDVTKQTRPMRLSDMTLGPKEKNRCRNMFVLGLAYTGCFQGVQMIPLIF